jgi:predicted ester cyclase
VNAKQFLAAACVGVLLSNCSRNESMNDPAELRKFAQRYADAWSTHDPANVAAFYSKTGLISVNGGPPAPIADVARGFFRDFPDTVVTFDKLENTPAGVEFHWTFTGTNTGPGGTGNEVRISGYELWKIDNDGLIEESKGHFDSVEYQRQLKKK